MADQVCSKRFIKKLLKASSHKTTQVAILFLLKINKLRINKTIIHSLKMHSNFIINCPTRRTKKIAFRILILLKEIKIDLA